VAAVAGAFGELLAQASSAGGMEALGGVEKIAIYLATFIGGITATGAAA
jgi:hypothetical protein